LWRAIWLGKGDSAYWTGSAHHAVPYGSLTEVWKKLKSNGFKTLDVFGTEDVEIKLPGVVIATETEWMAIEQGAKPSTAVTLQ
jgi:hypothetical protein